MPKAQASSTPSIQVKYHIVVLLCSSQ